MKTANAAPLPISLGSMQKEDGSISNLLGELVSNSGGKGRGNAKEVTITYDTKTRCLTVLDGGNGMRGGIVRLFQQGASIGPIAGDIGQHGFGGTKAILWLASRVTVWTLIDGNVMRDTVIWKNWINAESIAEWNVSNEWVNSTLANTPADLRVLGHGTMIRMSLLQGRRLHPSHVTRDLAKVFAPGLRKGFVINWVTLSDGKIVDQKCLSATEDETYEMTRDFSFDIDFDGESLSVKGRAHYDSERITQSDSKISLGYAIQVVKRTNDCYGDYPGIGVKGYVDLGDGWKKYFCLTKNGISNDDLYAALMDRIYAEIEPLLKASKRKASTLVFDNIAIGIELAMNKLAGESVVKVRVDQDGDIPSRPEHPGHGPKPLNPGTKPHTRDPDSNRESKTHAKYEVVLTQCSDWVMEGNLCNAETNGDYGMLVSINEDHIIIKEALVAKPINKMLLTTVAVREIADVLADDLKITTALMPARASILDDLQSRNDKAKSIFRHLVDASVGQLETAEQ